MSKEFIPNVWTEVTEDIDVVGARKNRIKSAQNMSDVLEVVKGIMENESNLCLKELLSKDKVIIIEITTEVVPADDISQMNTEQFIAKHTESARITYSSPVQATFVVDLPSFVSILAGLLPLLFLFRISAWTLCWNSTEGSEGR